MKKISCYTAFFCAMLMFLASTMNGQNVKTEVNTNEKWTPVHISKVNVLKGVSFFSRDAVCNDKNVVLIRLSNSNLSSVNVNYLENGVKKSVTIMPSSIMEGTCELYTDMNEKGAMSPLVYLKPVTDVERAAKKKSLATIEVIEVK